MSFLHDNDGAIDIDKYMTGLCFKTVRKGYMYIGLVYISKSIRD